MFNWKSFCAIGLILVAASGVFAEFNITDSAAINVLIPTEPTTDYTATISDPNVTLSNGTAAPFEGGAGTIAAYGTTPGTDGYFVVRATVSKNGGDSLCGLIGNFNPAELGGYFFAFNFYDGYASLLKVANGEGSTLDVTSQAYSVNNSYNLELIYDGTLTAKLYDSTNQLLDTLTSSDSEYTSGDTGVMAHTTVIDGGMDSTKGFFENYDVVPEPATLILLGAGIGGFIAKRKRG